ncbi:hypothetical protein PR048_005736 [Dryococelus australis]|uniref:Uncharacterized protein n=1 Tax=Dryococelus australis TaxID=614101 RepID=A0ABQ9IB65_9NEOP|nr:hypothetical protein PR048_005736 [Dryococelus australis]
MHLQPRRDTNQIYKCSISHTPSCSRITTSKKAVCGTSYLFLCEKRQEEEQRRCSRKNGNLFSRKQDTMLSSTAAGSTIVQGDIFTWTNSPRTSVVSNTNCLLQLQLKMGLQAQPMSVIEMNLEQHRNEGAGEIGDTREIPPTSGIVRHDSYMRKSGSIPAGDGTQFADQANGSVNSAPHYLDNRSSRKGSLLTTSRFPLPPRRILEVVEERESDSYSNAVLLPLIDSVEPFAVLCQAQAEILCVLCIPWSVFRRGFLLLSRLERVVAPAGRTCARATQIETSPNTQHLPPRPSSRRGGRCKCRVTPLDGGREVMARRGEETPAGHLPASFSAHKSPRTTCGRWRSDDWENSLRAANELLHIATVHSKCEEVSGSSRENCSTGNQEQITLGETNLDYVKDEQAKERNASRKQECSVETHCVIGDVSNCWCGVNVTEYQACLGDAFATGKNNLQLQRGRIVGLQEAGGRSAELLTTWTVNNRTVQ